MIERKKKEPQGSFFYSRIYSRTAGYTMTELVAVLLIVGVLAAMAVPRMTSVSASYDEVRLYDQTLAALRFAQKAAVTQQRYVCVTFTGTTQLALTYSSAYSPGVPPGCDTNLNPPGGGGGGQYTVVAQGGAGYSTAAGFDFSRTGRPSAGQTILLNGGRQITIETESGYVR